MKHDHEQTCNCRITHEHDHGHGENHDDHNEHDHEGCACGHEHGSMEGDEVKKQAILIAAGLVLFGAALMLPKIADSLPLFVSLGLYLAAFFIVGGEVLLRAAKNIAKGQVFDENFLMCIAALGAFAIGAFAEGVAVMIFYQLGELLQDIAVSRSRKSIAGLLDIRPEYANRKRGDLVETVAPEEIQTGDLILVLPGERIPLDGIIETGNSSLDTSSISGESLPMDVEPGDSVVSGTINLRGALVISVSKPYDESTVAKILELVEHAADKKAPTETFITKFARYYTPVVAFIALALALLPPILLPGATLSDWVYRALIFLVASCPCALLISIPLGFFGGVGGASRNGILLKGGNYLEALNKVDTVVFDKTGTLTKGTFRVTKIVPSAFCNEDGAAPCAMDAMKNLLLAHAAYAEANSNHPIAASIREAYGEELHLGRIHSAEELAGFGTRVQLDEKTLLAGNAKLLRREGIDVPEPVETGTVVHLAADGIYEGYLVVADLVREDSADAVLRLRKAGVREVVMLTGDRHETANEIGKLLGIDRVYSDLLPGDKVEKLEEIKRQSENRGAVVFVGDGINDAPALMRADIGVAMGGLGSDAAISAADVVLMTDEPRKLVDALSIAKRTKQIVWQNILFAFAVKGLVLVLGAGGIATMWEAVFADVGVALIAIANAMRVLNVKSK